jgi:hypothetical protein
MVICGRYMHEFIVSNNDKRRKEVAVGKVVEHLCLTLITKERKLMLSKIGW